MSGWGEEVQSSLLSLVFSGLSTVWNLKFGFCHVWKFEHQNQNVMQDNECLKQCGWKPHHCYFNAWFSIKRITNGSQNLKWWKLRYCLNISSEWSKNTVASLQPLIWRRNGHRVHLNVTSVCETNFQCIQRTKLSTNFDFSLSLSSSLFTTCLTVWPLVFLPYWALSDGNLGVPRSQ